MPYFIAWAGTIGTINYFFSPFKQEDRVFLLIVDVGFKFNLLDVVVIALLTLGSLLLSPGDAVVPNFFIEAAELKVLL